MEGEMLRQGQTLKGWKPRWYFLTKNGLLAYYLSKDSCNLTGVIDLRVRKQILLNSKNKCAFQIRFLTHKKNYNSKEIKQKVMQTQQHSIDNGSNNNMYPKMRNHRDMYDVQTWNFICETNHKANQWLKAFASLAT